VDAQEALGKLLLQLYEGLVEQVFALPGARHHVFLFGLQEQHPGHGHQQDAARAR
jgi:hypothetical protein